MPNQPRTVTVGIEVLPLCDDPYPVVDQAIAAIRATGIKHVVCPMETVVEGTLDECMAAARAAHEACFDFDRVRRAMTIVKIGHGVDGSTIDDNMPKYL